MIKILYENKKKYVWKNKVHMHKIWKYIYIYEKEKSLKKLNT